MSSERTPERFKKVYATTVQRLNNKWDLGLPEKLVVNRQIIDLDDEQKALQRQCAKHIEYLSWRPESGLFRLLDDFDESADAYFTSWCPKPSQENGTLQTLPITKSFIRRDNISKMAVPSMAAAFDKHRRELLTLLERQLSDEKKLTLESDAYVRVSGPRVLEENSKPVFREADLSPKRERSKNALSYPASKKQKTGLSGGQRTITSFITTTLAPAPAPAPSLHEPRLPSFDSMNSTPPSRVFTLPPQDGQTSSNETSFVDEDDLDLSQYGLDTQEFDQIYQQPSFTESLQPVEEPTLNECKKILNELVSSGPFQRPLTTNDLPSYVPFRLRYECHRLAAKASMSARSFFKEITTICRTEEPTLNAFWDAAKAICNKTMSGPQKLVANDKPSVAAWETASANFTTLSDDKSVSLTGSLDWSKASQKGVFTVKMNPLQLEKSCRFDRRFGGDRILSLTLPYLSGNDVPQHLRPKAKSLHSAVTRWLGREKHFIAGRYWRAFYTEAAKKKPNSTKSSSFKIFMFAVGGIDMSPNQSQDGYLGGRRSDSRTEILLENFLNWYMPIQSNLDSSDKKLFQRQRLGLSRTLPTVILEQDEFVYLEDNALWLKRMNDGCARMSRQLASDIHKQLGLECIPSVFQARISGAKGLWMVEDDPYLYPDASKRRGYWVEVTESQLKVKPHPKDRADTDSQHRTFEILQWSSMPKMASMTVQLMSILHHGGVKKQLLEKLLRANTHGYYEDLVTAMKDPRHLRLWTRQHEKTGHDQDIAMLGAFPKERAEQINFLLESGFSPEDNEQIVSRLRSSLTDYLEDYVNKLHLRIDMSTTVWCVPDPYGVLQPGEVQLIFSSPWISPNGRPITTLSGRDCIVYRSPGYLPSDAQRVRGVFRPELQHLLDVIVFSTQGSMPLASKLSGGDYDGDTCWVCFDPDIVKDFKNTPVSLKPATEAECGLVNESIKLDKIFTSSSTTSKEIDAFLTECFSFNLVTPMLGTCTNEHEKVAYHRGYSDPGAIKLAALAGYLVDAPKQGYALSASDWASLKSKTSGNKQLNKPAYKDGQFMPKSDNIVDYLRLVAVEEKTNILKQFGKNWPEGHHYDRTLSMPFINAEEKYKKDPQSKNKKEPDDAEKACIAQKEIGCTIIQNLKTDIDSLLNRWKPELTRSKEGDCEQYYNAVLGMHEGLRSIIPRPAEDHDICRRFADERTREFSDWSRLRASCLYYRCPKGFATWYCAGTDLGRIKAESKGPTMMMTAPMHHVMKPDKKMVLRMLDNKREEVEDDSGQEEYGDDGVW